MSVRFVYFDLGKVLLFFSASRLLHQLSEVVGASEEELKSILFSEERYFSFERGEITSDEYFRQVEADFGHSIDPEKFCEAVNNIFWVNESILPVIRRLSKASFPRGILSNTNSQHWEYVMNAFSFVSKYFPRHCVTSYEVHSMKPSRQIYEAALMEARSELPDILSEEILFVDDLEENVQGALEMGFQAILYTDTEQLLNEFRQRGLPVPE